MHRLPSLTFFSVNLSCSWKIAIKLVYLTVFVGIISSKIVNAQSVDRAFNSNLYLKEKLTIAQNNSSSKKLSTNNSNDYLALEGEILAELNKARTDPIGYANWLESTKQYFDGIKFKLPGEKPITTNKGLEAISETIAFLKNIQPLTALNRTKELTKLARDKITLSTNKANNNNSVNALENITYGRQTAQGIVMQLIVDSGVPDRHHRRNIFNSNARTTGIACGDNPTYDNMCAIAFAEPNLAPTESKSDLNNSLEIPHFPEKSRLNSRPPRLILSRNGSLTAGDTKLSNDGSFYDSYPLKGRAGDAFIIEVDSQEFDPFVAVVDLAGKTVAQNDDLSDRNSNSRLQLTLPNDGEYRIIINSYQEKGRGHYIIKVRK
jgi:hypothetical protein